MYDMSGFSYDITDVVHLLQLRVRHKNSSSMDVNCPFCGETKGKMNVNLQKNVFRCNRCDASGGMLELYGRLHGVSSAEANRQIREALGKGEYRTDYQVVHKEEPVEIFNAELADADVIDRTYQEMLSLLTLNDKHQEDLKKRGLTKEQIEIQRYRSVPLFGIKNMVQKLLESGQTVKGVPGFYEDQDGKWTINFTSKNSGILIPIRSMEGKIQGFQIRLDQVMEGRKYIWLSSVKFQNGVSSGSPVHVIGSLDAEQIYLTEGALKGTIAHYLSGDTFICVAGVNQYRNLKPVLETLKSRHLQHLYEAYDMDKKMKVYCDGDSEKCDACQRKPATFYCPHKMQKRQILQNACRKVYISLIEAMFSLQEEERKLIYQHVFEEHTFKEMSILNQMSEERCKGAYYWAIRKIRKRMGGKKS